MKKVITAIFIILMILQGKPFQLQVWAEDDSLVFLKTRENILNAKTRRVEHIIYEYDFDDAGEVACCRSINGEDQAIYYQYYPDGKLKQKNGIIQGTFLDYFMNGYPYEIHYDKYGTQIEWYENYYSGPTQVAHEPGIPYWTDYPVVREYNDDGQIKTFSAKGPVKVYLWDPESGCELSFHDLVDISASYQYDIKGRILSYRIDRSEGDYSNEGFYRYYDDGSYTEFLRVFRDEDSVHSWFYLDFNADKMITRYEAHEYMSPYGFEYEDITIREYTYDNYGRILQLTNIRNGQQEGGERYEYTDSERKTVIECYSDWQSPSARDIEIVIYYDEYGNETMRLEYDKNNGELISSRSIEYVEALELE